jgi:hypothetical protein
MTFTCGLLHSYNRAFGDLLTECSCYERYATPERFNESVITSRQAYMACLDLGPTGRPGISHLAVPIMVGSWVDICIRGLKTVLESRVQWGAIIIMGTYRIYPNYLTYDPMTTHLRETRHGRHVGLFTYVDGQGLALTYSGQQDSYDYNGAQGLKDSRWVDLLAKANPDGLAPTWAEFTSFYNVILADPHRRNDLGNRRTVNGANVMKRFVRKRTSMVTKNGRKPAHPSRMCRAFELGRVFIALGRRATASDAENRSCGRSQQSYDHPMHDGRSSKMAHLLPTVTRDANPAVRNSNALAFPADAPKFFCPLTTKDLKSAGEQNVLCSGVIVSEDTDSSLVLAYIRSISTGVGSVMVLNGTPTSYRRKWCFQDLLELKRNFPFVTTRLYPGYVAFLTCGSITIKYCEALDHFFSPTEVIQAGEERIPFPELDLLSVTAQELPAGTLTRTPPAKLTVSINNIKGSVAKLTSKLHRDLMHNSLGVTCYMDAPDDYLDRLVNMAVLAGPGTQCTKNFHHWYERLDERFKLRASEGTEPKGTTLQRAIDALTRIYPAEQLEVESRRPAGEPLTRRKRPENAELLRSYRRMIGNADNYQPPAGGVWNLRLYASFGNPHGDCVEDGVVLDSGTVAQMEPIYYNACITVDFTFKTARHPQEARFVSVEPEEPLPDGVGDSVGDRDTLIGYMVTEYGVYVKHSKHTRVDTYQVGAHSFYLVHFLPKNTGMYDNLRVRYQPNNNVLTVAITGQKVVPVGVGSKVANAFGQKNIVSALDDMSGLTGVTRDGRLVKVQIIYSDTSSVARVAAGQWFYMLKSPDLAIGPNGEIIAPINLTLHTLNPYSNAKCIVIKNDTLTNINGFDSQSLCATSQQLRKEPILAQLIRVVGMLGYDLDIEDAATAGRKRSAEAATAEVDVSSQQQQHNDKQSPPAKRQRLCSDDAAAAAADDAAEIAAVGVVNDDDDVITTNEEDDDDMSKNNDDDDDVDIGSVDDDGDLDELVGNEPDDDDDDDDQNEDDDDL